MLCFVFDLRCDPQCKTASPLDAGHYNNSFFCILVQKIGRELPFQSILLQSQLRFDKVYIEVTHSCFKKKPFFLSECVPQLTTPC